MSNLENRLKEYPKSEKTKDILDHLSREIYLSLQDNTAQIKKTLIKAAKVIKPHADKYVLNYFKKTSDINKAIFGGFAASLLSNYIVPKIAPGIIHDEYWLKHAPQIAEFFAYNATAGIMLYIDKRNEGNSPKESLNKIVRFIPSGIVASFLVYQPARYYLTNTFTDLGFGEAADLSAQVVGTAIFAYTLGKLAKPFKYLDENGYYIKHLGKYAAEAGKFTAETSHKVFDVITGNGHNHDHKNKE